MFKTKSLKKLSLLLLMLVMVCISGVFAQKQIGASESLVKKARDHLNLFQYDQALKLLKQAMEIEPDNWEPWLLAGKALLKQKKESEAEKILSRALELNPSETDIQITLGSIYIGYAKAAQSKGQTSEMTNFLHKACQAYPCGTKIWQSLMEHWWKSGEYDKIKKEGDLIVKANSLALEQGDDRSLQAALVIVAKAFYRDGDFVATENFLKHAGMIRNHNDDLYALRRELKSKAEESVKKLVDQAKTASSRQEYEKALQLLETANKMPAAKSSEILEMMENIEKEASLQKTLKEVDALVAAKKHEEALEKLQEISLQFPEEPQITSRLETVGKVVEKLRAETARINAEVIAEKQRKLELARQIRFLLKEADENEQKNNYDLAVISLEKAARLAPEDPDLPGRIAGLKELSQKNRARQNDFSVKFNEFDKFFSQGNFQECYDLGQLLIKEFPENRKPLSAIFAETCLRLGKYSEAKEAIVAIEGDPEHETLHAYIIGMVNYHSGDREAALTNLQKVKEKNANFRNDVSSTIYWIYIYKMQLGIYILLIGLAFPAAKYAKEALAAWKASRMLRRIERIKETGDYAANLDFLEERFAREDTPNTKQVQVMLAEALLRTGSHQRAYELANTLLKKDSRNPLAKRIAGEAALLLEDASPTGLEHIQSLLKIDETRKDVVAFLAKVYIKQQADHKMAQDYILKYISVNPSDTDAVIYLADVYRRRQTYNQQTLKIFERAMKALPDVPDYYEAMIENYHRLDNHQEAQKLQESASAKFPAHDAFFADKTSNATAKSGLRLKQEPTGNYTASSVSPAARGGFPDYESIGEEENAGSYEDSSLATNGQVTPAAGGFPDYDAIGDDETPLPPTRTETAPPPPERVISGPQKTCPHCNAANSVKEYYCNSCGKPL